ncbi:MAG: TetR/AcrR family transcriptional regulator [Deltaproteobacteria bacterium]|nr:TetR/AcrR family transcriptional regulator [Deltaproteobacteria bacterium]
MSRNKTPRSALLRAALDAMLDGRFTMGEVAKRAKVSRQTLYAHFDGLPQLAIEAARYVDEVEDIEAHLGPVFAATSPGALLDALAGFFASYNPRIAHIVRQAERLAEDKPETQAALDDRRQVRLSSALGTLQQLEAWGALRPEIDHEEMAAWFVSLGGVALWHDAIEHGGWTADQYRAHMASTLRRVLLANPDCD